ncbi:MAG: hypothetical protein JNL70_15750 [Saprospiraceae bacterium]|nr:hypothetical protein [Saprospiraceae bacterium]
MSIKNQHFITFRRDITALSSPLKFTFPFHYEQHPLCIAAAEELQAYNGVEYFCKPAIAPRSNES